MSSFEIKPGSLWWRRTDEGAEALVLHASLKVVEGVVSIGNRLVPFRFKPATFVKLFLLHEERWKGEGPQGPLTIRTLDKLRKGLAP